MQAITAVILGIIEGVTEFLPISSTGHLIIANQWVHFSSEQFTTLFDIVIQLGAICAVVLFFRKKLFPWHDVQSFSQSIHIIWLKTIVAVIPALILGALLSSFITRTLFNPLVVASSLISGGIILILIERKPREPSCTDVTTLSIPKALMIGCVQCLALIPGVSRAGATIVGGMLGGLSRSTATEFSFFLAIPTMLAASVYSLYTNFNILSSADLVTLMIGFVVSFAVALGVIAFFMKYIQKHTFIPFGYYRIILGLLVLLLVL